MNPQDIIQDFHPNGAIKGPEDARDHKWSEVGFGTEPFDWSEGFDIEKEIAKSVGGTFKTPAKDQNGSASCGGQAEGYYGAAVKAIHTGTFEEKSAKFSYAQLYYPGGGTADRDLSNLAVKQGYSPERLCVSYQAGKAPTEAFMERREDITDEARAAAALSKASSYVDVTINIDSIAQAIKANNGARLGVTGSNNGTWLSTNPKPPAENSDFWYHWVYAGKAKIINGVKKIGIINSWGADVGEDGWQWLDEAYINLKLKTCPNGRGIWKATSHIINKDVVVSFTHKFLVDISFGSRGAEVTALQKALQLDGSFPAGTPCTGYYGDITRMAVLKFQTKYQLDTNVALQKLNGRNVGPKTRAKLNQLYGI